MAVKNQDVFAERCETAIAAAAAAIQDVSRGASSRRSPPLSRNDLENAAASLLRAARAVAEARKLLDGTLEIEPAPPAKAS